MRRRRLDDFRGGGGCGLEKEGEDCGIPFCQDVCYTVKVDCVGGVGVVLF